MNIQDEIADVEKNAICLVDQHGVEKILDELAEKITKQCAKENPVILCVMTGAVVVVGKLLPKLNFPLEMDYIHATRYQGATVGGELVWKQHPTVELKNRAVIIIDDILDEGITMQYLTEFCKDQGADKTYSVVLVDKNITTEKAIQADFVGITLEDYYLFGLGMDYKGYLRNANGIFACSKDGENK